MPLLLLLAATLNCSVLATATVGGAFGPVQQQTKACQFTGADFELTVDVSTLPAVSEFSDFAKTACQGGHDVAPLKAIGNEAIACSLGNGNPTVEKVVGRVRNKAFVIRFSGADKGARSKMAGLAEQVAGNLF